MEITMEKLIRQIQIVTEEIRYMTSKMYEGSIKDGFGMMPKIIEGIGFVADQYITAYGNTEKIVRLNQKLANINDAIANNDYILFADIFEYEIVPVLEEMLTDLRGKYTN